MAKTRKKAAMAGSGVIAAGQAARSNPYVQRVIDDQELRDNLRTAYESLRKAYGRMSNGKGPAKAVLEDKKTQRELREAASSLRDAAEALRGEQRALLRLPCARLELERQHAVGIVPGLHASELHHAAEHQPRADH